ncbi:MAG: gliding motility-associated C-terminal domain-containing protein [Bacteroidetes bacterium]|nr:gliding motility-associated C-terminal domain-containing protein [Bacteroidota bacterium]
MKFKLLFAFIFSLFFTNMFPQSFWSRGSGGNNVDEALDVTKDNLGNIISVGYFTNTAQFTSTFSLVSTSQGVPDVFIQKTSSTGAFLWAVKAGGNGSDRATAVKVDANGDIYITGFYYGTANFGSITLNSVNGSQDVFIAKLNSGGVFQWAVSAGGNLGEYSYGLALDQSNNVFITGQFEGNSTFGSQTLISQVNPQTNLPSFDIFTAKYNSSGAFQWVRQGKAEYNDRGMDLVCDNTGNVYVTGQFSDTITFQNTYNNNVMNAVFIIKYNSSGQEVWFRKAAGSFGIGYSIALYNNQDLYVSGDYKGTMTFFGTPNNILTDTYTNRIFLAKYTTSGNFVWAQSDASDNYLSARAIALASNGDVYIAGEFGCVMNEYSNLYGEGIFNSVGFSDIFACKYTSSGARTWERHFGGPLVDKAHGVVEGNNGRPVIAGSFEQNINWPIGANGMSTYPLNGNSGGWGNNYCTDPAYNTYGSLPAQGFSDAFVCDGIDLTRQPYDFYLRNGVNCLRPQLDICIENLLNSTGCPDTIRLCYPASPSTGPNVFVNAYQSSTNQLSPIYHYDWTGSNSSDTTKNGYITTTGYHSVKIESYDGCYSFEDSVYAIVGNMNSPTITDDHNVNFQHPPNALPITACAPDTVKLIGGNIGNFIFGWNLSNPGIINQHDSVIFINQSGNYTFTLADSYGCTRTNTISINLQNLSSIIPKSNMPDTFTVCQGQSFDYILYDSLSNPTGIIPYSNCFSQIQETWYVSPGGMSGSNQWCSLGGTFFPNQTGTYIVKDSLKIQNLCGIERYCFIDTIHVIVNPKPHVFINITGNQLICPGDTILLIANSNHFVNWSTGSTSDTLYVAQPGNYTANANYTDTVTGCYNSAFDVEYIQSKPDPIISTVPWTGLICPNDSVRVQVNIPNAINYEWHGPMGIIPINSQFIYVNIQGFYHCVVTDIDGCILTSNTVEIKQYSAPYLIGQPTTTLCPGQTTTILVVTESTSTIQWQAPLFGSAMSQVINTGGTYYCNVTACGITTNCNIQIIQSSPTAIAIANGPTTFCPGDSVTLNGNGGMAGYTWNPGSYNGQNYTVHNPGAYSLTVTDAYGCSANSNTITVTWNTSVTPPTAIGDSVCAGDTATLIGSLSSGTIEWYSSFPSSNLLSNNDTFLVSPLNNSTVYYATTQNGAGCHSVWVPVNAIVYETSFLPIITNDTIACFGDSILLSTNSITNAVYNWTGPSNFNSNLQNPIVQLANNSTAGIYSLIVTGNGCTSPAATIEIDVMQALPITVTGNMVLCEGDSLQLTIHSQHNPITFYQIDSNAFSFPLIDSTFIIQDMNTGNYDYIFQENYFGCMGQADTFNVIVNPRPWLFSANNNVPICTGDSLHLYTNEIPNATYTWTGVNNYTSSSFSNYIANADSSLNGSYSVSAELNGCIGNTVVTNVIVRPATFVSLGNDTTVCNEDEFSLNAGGNQTYYFWDNGETNQTIYVDSSRIYSVLVANQYGCSAIDSVYVAVINCSVSMANIFTPNNDGINDVFKIKGEGLISLECTIYNRWGQKIYSWNDANGVWDGKNFNKELMNDGTYYYIANLTDYRKKQTELKGFVTLQR